jgi:hypothetical protein
MSKMNLAWLIGSAISLALLVGCDDRPAAPPHLLNPQPPVDGTSTERPTTRQILDTAGAPIGLKLIPFTLDAPPGWEVKTLPGTATMVIDGPTPRFTVELQMSSRGKLSAGVFESLVAGAKAESERYPGPHNRSELRELGELKVLHRMRADDPTNEPLLDAFGETAAARATPLRWRINIFVPRGEREYENFDLWFNGMTVEQYEQDKQLLNRVLDSLKYNESALLPLDPVPLGR